jgi:GntR family transcriptional regulator
MQLAAELKVSQGTVRKALDELVAQNLLVRRQGRGTYVSQHDLHRSLFHFFKLEPDDGSRQLPTSRVLDASVAKANGEERAALRLDKGDSVVRILRVRLVDDVPTMYERISVSEKRFPSLAGSIEQLPNTLYSMYSTDFGITIASAQEELRAVGADKVQAEHLRLREGAPVLEIRRIAIALDGTPVELRVSLCNTANCRYVSELN